MIFAVIGEQRLLVHRFIKKTQKTPKADLDPGNHAVSLETLARAAHAVGRSLKLELV